MSDQPIVCTLRSDELNARASELPGVVARRRVVHELKMVFVLRSLPPTKP